MVIYRQRPAYNRGCLCDTQLRGEKPQLLREMLASVAWRLIVPEARARSEVARSGEKRTRHLKHEEKKGKREPREPRSGHRVELSGRPGVRHPGSCWRIV